MLTSLVLLCIASPHILYAFIWLQPQRWKASFGGRAVEVFALVAVALKGKAS